MIVSLKQGWSWQEIDVNGSLWRCVYQCLCSLGLYLLTWHCRWLVFVRSLLHDRSFVCVFVDWHGCYRLDQHRYHFVHIGTQHRYQQKKGCRLIDLSFLPIMIVIVYLTVGPSHQKVLNPGHLREGTPVVHLRGPKAYTHSAQNETNKNRNAAECTARIRDSTLKSPNGITAFDRTGHSRAQFLYPVYNGTYTRQPRRPR